MNDTYAILPELDPEAQERIADRMELRGRDSRQRAMLERYVEAAELPPNARVVEVGCGTGVVSRYLADHSAVASVAGVDPSPVLVERARELAPNRDHLSFQVGDGLDLAFVDASFDVVVMHTLVCHVPETERLLREAFRVLRPGGRLLVFDGDYATTTVAVGEHDPLQCCVEAVLDSHVSLPWVVRRLPRLAGDPGFEAAELQSHGYTKTEDPEYLLAVVDVGAEALQESGTVRPAMAEALRNEARERVAEGEFYGFIEYASLDARKPTA